MFSFIHHDISLVPVCKEHLALLARRIRPEDAEELWASHRQKPLEALAACAAESSHAYALLFKGVPVSIFGLSPDRLIGRRACVWQITSIDVLKIQKSFFRISKAIISFFNKLYPVLYCMTDMRYIQALKYVERLGFTARGEPGRLKGEETQFQYYQINLFRRSKWEDQ